MAAHDELLPPKIPTDRARLERAIVLLGNLARGTMRQARPELIELLGECPDAATALAWKRALKVIRDDDELQIAG